MFSFLWMYLSHRLVAIRKSRLSSIPLMRPWHCTWSWTSEQNAPLHIIICRLHIVSIYVHELTSMSRVICLNHYPQTFGFPIIHFHPLRWQWKGNCHRGMLTCEDTKLIITLAHCNCYILFNRDMQTAFTREVWRSIRPGLWSWMPVVDWSRS